MFKELLNRNRSQSVDRDRFEWLYLNNPHGLAKAWLAIDDRRDEAVAFTVVLPRIVKIDGQEKTVWNCGDFSVDKKYRTLGVAIKLRCKAKDAVEAGEALALYAHPNDRMKIVHQKVGHLQLGIMQRYVKVLRTNKFLNKKIPNRSTATVISFMANMLLALQDICRRPARKYRFEIKGNEQFGSDFDVLFVKASQSYRIIGDRSAKYLNWRYTQNPLYQSERLEIHDSHGLAGYVIFLVQDGIAVFKDILYMSSEGIGVALVQKWTKLMRQRGCSSISATFLNSNPVVTLFQKNGFRLRPGDSSVFGYAGNDLLLSQKWTNGVNWYMTVGDRDV